MKNIMRTSTLYFATFTCTLILSQELSAMDFIFAAAKEAQKLPWDTIIQRGTEMAAGAIGKVSEKIQEHSEAQEEAIKEDTEARLASLQRVLVNQYSTADEKAEAQKAIDEITRQRDEDLEKVRSNPLRTYAETARVLLPDTEETSAPQDGKPKKTQEIQWDRIFAGIGNKFAVAAEGTLPTAGKVADRTEAKIRALNKDRVEKLTLARLAALDEQIKHASAEEKIALEATRAEVIKQKDEALAEVEKEAAATRSFIMKAAVVTQNSLLALDSAVEVTKEEHDASKKESENQGADNNNNKDTSN